MPKYIALRDLWISHKNQMVKEGEEFEAEFPKVNGKPMVLGDSLKLVEDKPAKATKPGKADAPAAGDDLV